MPVWGCPCVPYLCAVWWQAASPKGTCPTNGLSTCPMFVWMSTCTMSVWMSTCPISVWGCPHIPWLYVQYDDEQQVKGAPAPQLGSPYVQWLHRDVHASHVCVGLSTCPMSMCAVCLWAASPRGTYPSSRLSTCPMSVWMSTCPTSVWGCPRVPCLYVKYDDEQQVAKPRFLDPCLSTCLEKWLQTWIIWDGMSWFCSDSSV